MKALRALCMLLANACALVIKRAPQDESQSSSGVDFAPSSPPPFIDSPASSLSAPASAPASSPLPPAPSTTTKTQGSDTSSPPALGGGSAFDLSQCPPTSSCQEGLLSFVSSGICDETIIQRGSDCAFSCTGSDGAKLPGAQAAVDEVVKKYLETCGANGSCLETSFDNLPQICRDKYPLISSSNPYGWDQQYLCSDHDYDPGEKPFMCLDKNGGAPSSLDCVATQCNAFLIRASPAYDSPCQPDTLSLANSCHDCDRGAAMNYGAGFSGYVSAISAWCKEVPHCVDLANGATKITDGACASMGGGGGEGEGEGGSAGAGGDGQLPVTITINGTPSTIQPTSEQPTPTPQLTTIADVVYTLPSDGQPLTTSLPNGSVLTLPPASITVPARPTLSSQDITLSGSRIANTAFASARSTSASSTRRSQVAKAAVGLGVGLVVSFVLA